mmetsp:Transcript_33642/g.51895  ORF Transcript_33642/g.51895 Transcript_33642/m.51895 type:complete len:81 (+) Transcript_33642:1090-1332(+)
MIKRSMMMSMHPHFGQGNYVEEMQYLIKQAELSGEEAYLMGMKLDQPTAKSRRGKMGAGNKMDLLKKFRYNFHYWLKNCY